MSSLALQADEFCCSPSIRSTCQEIPSRHILTNCDLPPLPGDDSPKDTFFFGDILGTILDSPHLDPHYDLVVEFYRWITRVNNLTIVMRGYTHYPGGKHNPPVPFSPLEYEKKAATRWSDDYLKMVLARLYRLNEHLQGVPIIMGSFTCPHEYNAFGELVNPGLTIPACFGILRSGWAAFRWRLHKRYGRTIEVVRIWEPHKTGYPHFHAVFIGEFTDEDRVWMQTTWAECIGYPGASETALVWSETRSIDHPVAYLMKYLGKTLYHTSRSWNASTWVFNAIAWKDRIRLFQPSRKLGMAITDHTSRENTDAVYTEILARGLPPRKTIEEDREDLPALITAPKEAAERHAREVMENPADADFIPLSVRQDIPVLLPLQDRILARAHTVFKEYTPVVVWKGSSNRVEYRPGPGHIKWRDDRSGES